MNNSEQYINDSGLTLTDIAVFLWKRKYRLIISIAILTFLGSSYISSLPKIYSASSTIMVNEEPSGLPLGGLNSLMTQNSDQLDTYVQLIISRSFARKVVQGLGLEKLEEFKKRDQQELYVIDLQYAINHFLKNLTLSRVTNTNMLTITYESELAITSAEVVNYIGPAFFERQLKIKEASSRSHTESLEQKLYSLKNQVEVAESNFNAFTEKNGLVDLVNQISLTISEISQLIEHRLIVDNNMSAASAIVKQLEAAKGNIDLLMQIPVILNNKLLIDINNSLMSEKLAFNKIAERYKYKHHKYITALGSVNALQSNLNETLKKVVDSHFQKLLSLQSRYQELSGELAKARKKHADLGKYQFELLNLQHQVQIAQKLYNVFRERKQETEILKELDSEDQFQIVDFAEVPDKHIKPNKLLGTISAFILSSVFSTVFWFVGYIIADRKIRLKRLLLQQEIAVIAEIPKYRTYNKKRGTKTKVDNAEPAYKEAIRALRTAIMLRSEESDIRTIAFTRVSQNSNKRVLAFDVAESFASLEKSIFIDADLRSSHSGVKFGFEQHDSGLTNFISRRASFQESTYKKKESQLSVMHTGTIPMDPSAYFTKPRFAGFIKKLGVLFERVVIETSAVNAFSDALVISKNVDAIVLLCDLEVTEKVDLLEAVQLLQDAGAPLLGVVFINAKNVKSKLPTRSRSKNLVKKIIRY